MPSSIRPDWERSESSSGSADPGPVTTPFLAAAAAPAAERLLVALGVVAVAAWLGASGLRRIGQPGVVGQILAGVALGPTVLGAVWPAAGSWLFPPEVLEVLRPLSQVGLVLFMFLVGSEVEHAHLRGAGIRTAVLSLSGMVLPFALGVGVGLRLHGAHGDGADRWAFALFIGAAMAVTAFPVLASILRESELLGRPIGTLAMACAAIDDAVAWILLAVVVAVGGSDGAGSVLATVGWATLVAAGAVLVVRPLLVRLDRRLPLPAALAVALAAAWLTELIGLHAVFGAFLAGAVLPRGDLMPQVRRVEPLVAALLLPAFFVVAGLSADLGVVAAAGTVGLTATVVTVAVVGKLGGVYGAGRLVGLGHVDAAGLGVMMNTRGLTELVVLTVGLDLGVIGPTVYSAMVVMALLTTVVAHPALVALRRRGLGGALPDRFPGDAPDT